jgi:hypothetical protein
MKWDFESLNALIMVLYVKYNGEYWGDLQSWREYLEGVGVKSSAGRLRPQQRLPFPHVFIECPWSVHNSVPGGTKYYLLIPQETAEKIVLFGTMPSSPSPP